MPIAFRSGRIIDETGVTANVTSSVIDTQGQDSFGVTYKWTSTLTGTLALWCCNDIDQNAAGDGVGWISLGNFTVSPAGVAGSDEQTFAAPYRFYKVEFTFSANTGDLIMALNTDNGPSEI